MLVIASLLKSWKKQGHKVLLFTQSKAVSTPVDSLLSICTLHQVSCASIAIYFVHLIELVNRL